MKKFLKGIVEFKKHNHASYQETFSQLALGQSPAALFLSCSDSRIAPDVFASSDPGDLFVIRNPGNLFPPCGQHGHSLTDVSEVAALEFALLSLRVKDIIICGHSECGAMKALETGLDSLKDTPHLQAWLIHAQEALQILQTHPPIHSPLSFHNQISQMNVILQMQHVYSHPIVQQAIAANSLKVHGFWFDIAHAEIYTYKETLKQFVLLDENEAQDILKNLHH